MKGTKALISASLSLIPGLGQLYNRQYVKGLTILGFLQRLYLSLATFSKLAYGV